MSLQFQVLLLYLYNVLPFFPWFFIMFINFISHRATTYKSSLYEIQFIWAVVIVIEINVQHIFLNLACYRTKWIIIATRGIFIIIQTVEIAMAICCSFDSVNADFKFHSFIPLKSTSNIEVSLRSTQITSW